jgi:cephalosporin hydroxylase
MVADSYRSYRGRPISVDWHSTPGVYIAIFSQEYDGAPDSRNPVGYGKNPDEAVADLIEADTDITDATHEQERE